MVVITHSNRTFIYADLVPTASSKPKIQCQLPIRGRFPKSVPLLLTVKGMASLTRPRLSDYERALRWIVDMGAGRGAGAAKAADAEDDDYEAPCLLSVVSVFVLIAYAVYDLNLNDVMVLTSSGLWKEEWRNGGRNYIPGGHCL